MSWRGYAERLLLPVAQSPSSSARLVNGHDSRDTPDDESHDRPPLTCSAHSGLHAGIVRRAGSKLPEFPASPPALLPQGEKGGS